MTGYEKVRIVVDRIGYLLGKIEKSNERSYHYFKAEISALYWSAYVCNEHLDKNGKKPYEIPGWIEIKCRNLLGISKIDQTSRPS